MESDAVLRKRNAQIRWAEDSNEYTAEQKRVWNESKVISYVASS